MAYPHKADVDRSYLELIETALAAAKRQPALTTRLRRQDARRAGVIRFAQERGLPERGRFRFQLLYLQDRRATRWRIVAQRGELVSSVLLSSSLWTILVSVLDSSAPGRTPSKRWVFYQESVGPEEVDRRSDLVGGVNADRRRSSARRDATALSHCRELPRARLRRRQPARHDRRSDVPQTLSRPVYRVHGGHGRERPARAARYGGHRRRLAERCRASYALRLCVRFRRGRWLCCRSFLQRRLRSHGIVAFFELLLTQSNAAPGSVLL